MIEMLEELNRNGIGVTILSPRQFGSVLNKWHIALKKTANGATIEVTKNDTSLAAAIKDAYETWNVLTKGAPEHNLKQIECSLAPQLDPDEIPF